MEGGPLQKHIFLILVDTPRAGSVPFAHRHQKSPKRHSIYRVDSQHSLAMAESVEQGGTRMELGSVSLNETRSLVDKR